MPTKFDSQLYRSVSAQRSGLRVGIIRRNRYVRLAPSIENVLAEVAQTFEGRHEIVEFDFDQFWDLQTLAFLMEFAEDIDGFLRRSLGGEKPQYFAFQAMTISRTPRFLKKLLSYYLRHVEKDPVMADVLQNAQRASVDLFRQYVLRLERARDRFFAYYNGLGLDVLVGPVAVYPVPLIGEYDMLNSPLYTLVTNFLQMPSGAVPIRLSRAGEQSYVDYAARTTQQRMNLRQIEQDLDLPVSVMVTAKPHDDEKCLGFMKQLEDAFQFQNTRQMFLEQRDRSAQP